VASFHATLEEAREADLLLHVIDASQHNAEEEVHSVQEALDEVDCSDKPTVYLLNKIDLVDDLSELPLVRQLVGDVICTSATTGEGLDEVEKRVMEILNRRMDEFCVVTGVENGRLVAFLHENGQVLDRACHDATMELRVRMEPKYAGMARSMGADVEAVPETPDVA
jgi:GTP-binding protein HflX